jgi:hypothetical protein
MAAFIAVPAAARSGRMEFSIRSALLDIIFLYLSSLTTEVIAVLEKFARSCVGRFLFDPPLDCERAG